MIASGFERNSIRLRYRGILEKCQHMSVIFGSSQLAEVFEHTGAAFLDFAERSESYGMQGRFFEAMGLVQRQRAEMEQVFLREINGGFKRFARLGTSVGGADPGTKTDKEESELSLVGEDDIEQRLAAEMLTIKANESFFPELFALRRRLSVFCGGRHLRNDEIPSGPQHLVQAFGKSLEGLNVETRIKLILYALFDKYVVKRANSLYDELNTTLKDAGILPNLKLQVARPKKSPESSISQGRQSPRQEDAHGDAEGPALLGDELFMSVMDLMSKRKGRRGASAKEAPDAGAAVAACRELVAAADKVQLTTTAASAHAMVAEAAAIPNLENDTAFIGKVSDNLTREREQILAQIDRDKLSTVDGDMIDLIGMLFEYMLNDPLLPNLAKALLSHLHTPYLKVALIDRRLLADVNHPARRLLDQMVEAGNLWVDERNPQWGIFPFLQEIVDRVLHEFSDDISLFEELLDSLEQSMKEQERKSGAIEQRTRNMAAGREKLRLAKRRAHHEIHRLIGRIPLPEPVAGFLSKTWVDRLVFILLRDREEEFGENWRRALKTAEDLVALFEPAARAMALEASHDIVAELREQLIGGVQPMGSYPRMGLDGLLKFLDAPESWRESCLAAAAAQGESLGEEQKRNDISEQEESSSDQAGVSEQELEAIEQVSEMKPGTWFELKSGAGGVPRKVKLSWLSQLTATCLFVDRSGAQAQIKTLQELAREMRSGEARVIPRPMHPFIERALESIRNMLRRGEGATPILDAPLRG
jgi:hypothetical protein